MAPAIRKARIARPPNAAAMSKRRPPRVRSSKGPSTGATTANGAIVRMRYRTTLPRAADAVAPKKIESASEIVTNTSPHTLIACASASRENGVKVVDSSRMGASVIGGYRRGPPLPEP